MTAAATPRWWPLAPSTLSASVALTHARLPPRLAAMEAAASAAVAANPDSVKAKEDAVWTDSVRAPASEILKVGAGGGGMP